VPAIIEIGRSPERVSYNPQYHSYKDIPTVPLDERPHPPVLRSISDNSLAANLNLRPASTEEDGTKQDSPRDGSLSSGKAEPQHAEHESNGKAEQPLITKAESNGKTEQSIMSKAELSKQKLQGMVSRVTGLLKKTQS
jgi:hypothetical protein